MHICCRPPLTGTTGTTSARHSGVLLTYLQQLSAELASRNCTRVYTAVVS